MLSLPYLRLFDELLEGMGQLVDLGRRRRFETLGKQRHGMKGFVRSINPKVFFQGHVD